MLGQRRVTLKDIASREGVSVNAVSLALRNHHSISSVRRESIQRTAREMGYAPDPLLSALVARRRNVENALRANVLAFVSDYPPDGREMAPGGPVRLTYTGASETAKTLGYRLEYFHLSDEIAESNRIGAILTARGIRGLVFGPVRSDHRRLEIDWASFARVTIGYHENDLPFPYVMPNYAQGIALAWEKLVALGYRRIGLVTIEPSSRYVLNCWLSAQQFQQNAVPARHRIPSLVTASWSLTAFCDWWRKHRPEAILTYNSAFSEWLTHLGLETPKDLAVAHLDRRPAHKGIAGVVQNKSELGAAAVTQLNSLLQHSAYGAKMLRMGIMVDCGWIDGASATARCRR